MRNLTVLASLTLPLTACLNNPTIDEEIAGRCGISVNEYQRIEANLDAGDDGISVHAGRCRLSRTAKGITEGTVVDGS
ncbi:hypothetical protein [Sphingomonas sp. DT-204]|uniref:hypothetical protein n=1 Tax=Sphingomonas sp. DT-204 TaxID=3396166 RepID=UPI003F1D1BA1